MTGPTGNWTLNGQGKLAKKLVKTVNIEKEKKPNTNKKTELTGPTGNWTLNGQGKLAKKTGQNGKYRKRKKIQIQIA